ncbi:aminotransferase class IV [Marinimicrococcus flavescens]|uniref:Probable branched-chain-amino-acid aminotransferase n=1 Tax=Marinimicrococcus flavescens TaxID=3031815 RepID=A0AAP3XSD0_9PROT|nr:aminotransferase class IV [Marinimicrococcus flavescens]
MSTLWLNGRLLDAARARIDPADRGFLLGDGLFETMRAQDGAVPLLARHLARLRAGADVMGIPFEATDAALPKACAALLAANDLVSGPAALRLTLTRGPGPRGLLPPADATPTLLLAAFPAPPPRPPATAAIVTIRRNEHSPTSRLKTLAYQDQILALKEARAAGAEEALMLNTAGRLACASTANLFVVTRDGRLLTPALDEGVLPGITRARVLEAAAKLGIAAEATRIEPAVLDEAEAVFVTSSLTGLRAVVRIEGRRAPLDADHAMVRRLAEAL